MSRRTTYRASAALVTALLTLPGCQPDAAAPDTSREVISDAERPVHTPASDEVDELTLEDDARAPDLSAFADPQEGLAERLQSRRWADRKLAQRELTNLSDTAAREQLAVALVDLAVQEIDGDGFHRLLTPALGLAPARAVDQAVAAISAAASTEDAPSMSRLMLALAREDLTGRTRDHAEQLTPLALAAVARRDDPDSVLAGLSMLAHLGDDRVGGLITELSASSEKPTRKMAYAVAQRWSFEGGLEFALAGTSDPATYVRRRAVAALAQYPDAPESLAALAAILRTEANARVCTRAIEALETFDPSAAEPLLLERLSAGDDCGESHRFVTLAVARRLLRQHPQSMAALRTAIQALADGPAGQGLNAAAIVTLGDVEAAKLLDVDDAIYALGELTSRSLETRSTRLDAVAALAKMPQPDARRRVLRMLEHVDQDTDVVATTLAILDANPSQEQSSMVSLVPYTGSREHADIRAKATKVLAREASDRDSAERLATLSGDADGGVANLARQGSLRLLGAEAAKSAEHYAQALARVDARAVEARSALARSGESAGAPTQHGQLKMDAATVGRGAEHLQALRTRAPTEMPEQPESLRDMELPDDPMTPRPKP